MFPLLALPYMAAGIGTLGAGARVAGSPQGQRFIQGGINTLNRFGTRLQDFLNPIMQPTQAVMTQGQPVKNLAKSALISSPFFDAGEMASTSIVDAINKLIEEEDEDEDKKDKKKKKKKDEIPEVPMKKGGMVKSKKPKKKRKKYKSSTFVKMKGSKRYI
tara:strand:+ start:381 stop:860 length:480 start_codon:yes stop_codon:yes gene_type:complete